MIAHGERLMTGGPHTFRGEAGSRAAARKGPTLTTVRPLKSHEFIGPCTKRELIELAWERDGLERICQMASAIRQAFLAQGGRMSSADLFHVARSLGFKGIEATSAITNLIDVGFLIREGDSWRVRT
jgi:hypothetical protein